jgi:putative component of toxin-antitoxin plasmid stabilization module
MNTRPMGLLLTECNANYRTAWQASEQEKSYLINIRRQQQLQDDKREVVVVTIQCGGWDASQCREIDPGEEPEYGTRNYVVVVVVTIQCGGWDASQCREIDPGEKLENGTRNYCCCCCCCYNTVWRMGCVPMSRDRPRGTAR